MLLPPCQILIEHKGVSLFLALYSVLLIYMPALMPVPGYFDYNGLVVLFDIRYFDTSNFVLSPDCRGTHGLLWIHISFWNIYSRSEKYAIGILIGIALNL